ncbi:MAG: MaoC family dehydratase N-terminal domain-containing protein [Chloroflexi bacterium]|nr:MaoC family dehydratase N-terminal domain-containing protein [Chloroflexota bacterium]
MVQQVEQTFEEAVKEFYDRSAALIGLEVQENLPPPPPAPFPQGGPPVHSPLIFDEETIRNYAYSIGDDNPIFTDPGYGKRSIYGTQLAPGPMLAIVRYPSAHGADRPQGYPVANFISGTAWEFYDVLRPGSRFTSSKITREQFEKPGAQGNLIFFISEVFYWDQTEELKAKCYGTQIYVPIPTMGTSRAMKLERAGEHMMYTRKCAQYSKSDAEDIANLIVNEQRRGAEPRYWEDVEVGEELPTIVIPPFTIQDMIAYHRIGYALQATMYGAKQVHSFEAAYRRGKEKPDSVRQHPITRWPYTPGAEHEDVLIAIFRGQAGAFDFGVQRAQIPERLLTNWMGDHGHIRKMYTAFRRPVYYGDTTWYKGKVEKKYVVTEEGAAAEGGVAGKGEYHAVAVSIEGTNQEGEVQCPGLATVYLPSREAGPVKLPIPHVGRPPYTPYDTYRRLAWY